MSDQVNGRVVADLYDRHNKVYSARRAYVGGRMLKLAGWQGMLPTKVYKTFGQYRVRMVGQDSYEIIKVTPEMLNKRPQAYEGDAPLPIDLNNGPRINLKDVYKEQMKKNGKV